MVSNQERFGIYLNKGDLRTVRINSPYWFPEESKGWVMVTNEVNATLLKIRDEAVAKGLVSEADKNKVVWQ